MLQQLERLHEGRPATRYLVAFSGGLDSTVLLHALATSRERHGIPLLAVHVNHGLHADAGAWESHCRSVAERLDVPFAVRCVAIAAGDPRGQEGAAREARYAAIASLVSAGDTVLSAHHRDDQAETLLLNLLRGSGPGGLAGIGRMQAFGPGRLCRPLLAVSRSRLLQYAGEAGLEWLDDPANASSRFDRNYLRTEILPRLERRWPAAASGLARSARLASEAQALLVELADHDLAALGRPAGRVDRLDLAGLGLLSPARQRNLLRRAIARCELPPPPARRLVTAVAQLHAAGADTRPLVRWRGAELRRYRGQVFILPTLPAAHATDSSRLTAHAVLDLGPGLGRLQLSAEPRGGIAPALIGDGLSVRFRGGGERLRPHGRGETRRLKKLLQEAHILPWMRERLPLLYAGDALVAVADLWVDADAWGAPGLAVGWHDRPMLR